MFWNDLSFEVVRTTFEVYHSFDAKIPYRFGEPYFVSSHK